MADVRRDDHDEIDAVCAGSLSLCHLVKGGVAAIGRNAELRAGLAAHFGGAGEAAGNERCHRVNVDRLSVRVADKRTGTAAYHAIVQFLHHMTFFP